MARIYRATIKGHHADGTLVEPSLHYQTDLSFIGDEPDPSDVAGGIWTLIGAAYLGTQNSHLTVDELIVSEEVLKPAIGAAGAHTVGSVGTWTSGTPDLPHSLVPVINLHTDVRSKSARGWCHLGGIGIHTFVTENTWESSYLAALTSFANLLDNSFDMGTIDITHVHPVVYSPTRHKRGDTPYTFQVTRATANPQPRWLRTRLSTP